MNLRDVHEAAAYADVERLRQLADRCLEGRQASITHPPETGLIMVRVEETVEGDVFNLGEALVTRCAVSVDGEPGWSLVLGDDPERAVCAATLDAIARHSLEVWVEDEINALLEAVREARRNRWGRVQRTRVEFEQVSS